MKICAITMVYRDYWALSQWYAHYSRHLGSNNLFIVAHGHDPKVAELCPRANVITVPRDNLAGFDRIRGHMLNSIQDGLGVAYDWVIRTDADELITLDPAHYDSFSDLYDQFNKSSALFALGLNVASTYEAVFSGHYSKAWTVRRGTHLVRHGITTGKSDEFTLPRGVYLAHLKFANSDALSDANSHRADIASGSEKGLPGKAWLEADRIAKRFYHNLASMPVQDWKQSSDTAFDQIVAEPVMEAMILRAKSITFETKTVLPDWFKTY